jgi:hypothetical protein
MDKSKPALTMREISSMIALLTKGYNVEPVLSSVLRLGQDGAQQEVDLRQRKRRRVF